MRGKGPISTQIRKSGWSALKELLRGIPGKVRFIYVPPFPIRPGKRRGGNISGASGSASFRMFRGERDWKPRCPISPKNSIICRTFCAM